MIKFKKEIANLFNFCSNGNLNGLKIIFKDKKIKDFWINHPEPSNNMTLLFVSIYYGQYDIMKYLLEQGADPNQKNNIVFFLFINIF